MFVTLPSDSLDFSGVDPESEQETENNVNSDTDSDSDWEDIIEDRVTTEYNMLKLKKFSRECDRYKTSNREGAKLANALLRDLGLVTNKNSSKLICPGKLRRERIKWGGKLQKIHSEKTVPGGLYSDGKKCPTLVRDTNYVKVQVRVISGGVVVVIIFFAVLVHMILIVVLIIIHY